MNKVRARGWNYLISAALIALLTSCSGFQWSDQGQGQQKNSTGRTYAAEQLDKDIEKRLRKKLVQLHASFADQITVLSVNGVVLLVGSAPNKSLAQQAATIAQQEKGVRLAYNKLSLASQQNKERVWNDRWITGKLRTAILFNERLASDEIVILSHHNTVYLMGLVTPKQADVATRIARKIKGVNKVVSAFEHTY